MLRPHSAQKQKEKNACASDGKCVVGRFSVSRVIQLKKIIVLASGIGEPVSKGT
jgi:hypothetical protein